MCGIKQGASMKEDLDELLRSWRPEPIVSSTFGRDVWRRIERSHGAAQSLQGFFEWLARPRIASLATVLAIIGGVFVGSLFANQNAQRAYLHGVDPYAQVVVR
jgi:hypothetical protein